MNFEVENISTISKKRNSYNSFPDIIKDINKESTYYIVYREADSHHPLWSYLVLLESKNNGKTWHPVLRIKKTMFSDGKVFNCPRLYYDLDGSLNIICDFKNSRREFVADFDISIFKLSENKKTYQIINTGMDGMLPDKVIYFWDKLVCANHRHVEKGKGNLIQFINWVNTENYDKNLWFNRVILAYNENTYFCEASIVSLDNRCLVAYLRDNTDHRRNLWRCFSSDGIKWSDPQKILNLFGQRPTAIQYNSNTIIGSFRNTDTCSLSVFVDHLDTEETEIFDIEKEHPYNQYHFGYSGIAPINDSQFLVVYYYRGDTDLPYIKLSRIKITRG